MRRAAQKHSPGGSVSLAASTTSSGMSGKGGLQAMDPADTHRPQPEAPSARAAREPPARKMETGLYGMEPDRGARKTNLQSEDTINRTFQNPFANIKFQGEGMNSRHLNTAQLQKYLSRLQEQFKAKKASLTASISETRNSLQKQNEAANANVGNSSSSMNASMHTNVSDTRELRMQITMILEHVSKEISYGQLE